MEEPANLCALRNAVTSRLPRVDLPELLLEIDARTGFAGLNAITVPGTLRDSLVLLSVVLEQETELGSE